MTNEHLSFTTVGIGGDADTTVLSAVARAGGGHYVPFVPGQRTSSAALAVLETTYGVSLTNAEIEFPEGVEAVAPSALSSIRAGQEVIVVGRLRPGAQVNGDVRIRGTVAGRRFTNRYPVGLSASSAAGNAFVPRLWAAKTIEELELAGRGEDRARIVAISKAYGVMSRETSLLVLESEAMFRAFGVDRNQPNLQWTGEEDADASHSDGARRVGGLDTLLSGVAGGGDDDSPLIGGGSARASSASDSISGMSGGGNFGARAEAARPAPTPPRSRVTRRRPPRQMIPMRRVWYREGRISSGQSSPTEREIRAVQDAENALRENPDSRDRQRALVRALSRAGELERARGEAEKWVERDRLDPEALTYLADIIGRLGEREESIRLLSGVVDLQSENATLQRRLALAFERAGMAERACAHRVALAEIAPDDVEVVTEAVRCERGLGHAESSGRVMNLVSTVERRSRVESALAEGVRPQRLRGNIMLDASWSGGGDVDISLITPQGTRLSWMGGRTQVLGEGGSSEGSERLGLRWAATGSYVIEVSRTDTADSTPVSGNLRVRAMDQVRNIPFTLIGERLVLGRVSVVRRSRLVRAQGVPGRWDR